MVKFYILMWTTALFPLISYSQNPSDNKNAKPENSGVRSTLTFGGQAMISGNKGNLFFNMGGGGIAMKYDQIALSVNFLPSLRYSDDTEKITPVLGIGPQVHIRERFIIGMPVYYLDSKWRLSLGIGYKFLTACPQ